MKKEEKIPNPPDFNIFDIVQGTIPQKTYDALEEFGEKYRAWLQTVIPIVTKEKKFWKEIEKRKDDQLRVFGGIMLLIGFLSIFGAIWIEMFRMQFVLTIVVCFSFVVLTLWTLSKEGD